MEKNIYVFVFACLISFFGVACSNNNSQPRPIPATSVSVYKIIPESALFYDEFPATVTPLNQVDIRSDVSGYLTNIYFQDGQHVTKGMKLYAIDQQQYKGIFDQAVANLNVAKANLNKSQQDADRYNELAKNDAIARQVVEHSEADLQTAKLQVTAAENNVKVVETNFRNSVIYAPFDGTIGISQVKLGSAITAGQALLNTISSDNPMAVDFSVDEKLIPHFMELLQMKTDKFDSTFTLVLPDKSIYPGLGHISLIDRAVDSQTGTIKTRIVFPNPKYVLRSGLTCNIRILNKNSSSTMLIPFKAVIEQMGEYFVFVVNGNKVNQRKISIGMQIKDKVIVKDGLQPGETIVTEGNQKLKDNSVVSINNSGNKSNPGSSGAY
jgi:membrane fusion protein (multidrug efflux system)